jgi:hypothetical protein
MMRPSQAMESTMEITIGFGWWLLPAVLTIISFGMAFANMSSGGGDYSFAGVFNLILLLAAAVPALLFWLIWALIF